MLAIKTSTTIGDYINWHFASTRHAMVSEKVETSTWTVH